MTWFHFCTVNHNEGGRSTLVDMADWFEAGLLDLGHKVTFSKDHLEARAINIFWECFSPRIGMEIAKSGVVYGIVATEIPDGYAFNWRREPHWKERFDSFHAVADRAAFIWTMVESTLPFYSQFCPAAYMELGFSERLIPDYVDQTPEHDFCFFGLRTPYREQVIEKLRKHVRVEWPERLLSPEGVGKLIGASKIGLNFKQSERWPIPSAPRLGRLVLARRGVAAEFVPVATRLGELVGLAPETSDFAEYALDILHADWKSRANRTFERYRAELPMRDIMRGVIDRSLAGTQAAGTTSGGSAGTRIPVTADLEPPILVESVGSYNLVKFAGRYYGVPWSAGPLEIDKISIEEIAGGFVEATYEQAMERFSRMNVSE